jgi:hypothetical protein
MLIVYNTNYILLPDQCQIDYSAIEEVQQLIKLKDHLMRVLENIKNMKMIVVVFDYKTIFDWTEHQLFPK